jgi:hypothetical protein
MFCITLKERNTKRFVQNWHSPSHPSTEWSWFLFYFYFIIIKISYCPSIYYLKTKINPKQ